jgi:prevent-host-death family protein
MDIQNAVEPVSTLKSRSAQLIRRARETGQPLFITQNGKATAVLQDIDSFQRQRDTLLLLMALAHGERDVEAGRTSSDRAVDQRLRRRLARLQRA